MGRAGGVKQLYEFKQQYCASIVWHKWTKPTMQANTAVKSSLVPHTFLLMPRYTPCGSTPSVKPRVNLYRGEYPTFDYLCGNA